MKQLEDLVVYVVLISSSTPVKGKQKVAKFFRIKSRVVSDPDSARRETMDEEIE